MVTFGERLKQIRNDKNITLDKMAEELQTTKATLSRYENNLREPKADFIKRIANYFGVSLDYLLGKTDIKNYTDNILASRGQLNNYYNSELNAKDEKDIEKATEKFLEGLEGGAMLNGEILDDEDFELFKQAVKNGLTYAKISNKKKYTPKKYRKNND